MKRYRIQIIERENYKAFKSSQEHKLGGWCKWEDVKELEAENKRLKSELEAVKKITRDKYINANETFGLNLGGEA